MRLDFSGSEHECGACISLQEYKWEMTFQKSLANFSEVIFLTMRENYLDHSELFGGAKKELWNMEGAVLFCFAVITTIGMWAGWGTEQIF